MPSACLAQPRAASLAALRACLALMMVLGIAFPGWVARADELAVTLVVSGGMQAQASTVHAVDDAHFCSAAPDPWMTRDAIDGRAAPYPFYRVVFGQAAPEDEPEAPGPSLGMALSDYFAAAQDHSDPGNDSIELMIGGRHFVGHAALADPGYRFAVTYREDRQGGGFVARHLHEDGTGNSVIDVTGSWHCPPVAADMPDMQVRMHKLFAGAKPVHAEPIHLRLTRTETACQDRGCATWQVIDQTTGDAFMAKVDFRKLKLAHSLRRLAERGAVVLLVDADIKPGDPPRVVPRVLAGVQPVELAPGAAVSAAAEPHQEVAIVAPALP